MIRDPAPGGSNWLTPPETFTQLGDWLGSDWYDPCPFPRPDGFNGLETTWGPTSYVNPPAFAGMRSWVAKAQHEADLGKKVVMVGTIDRWAAELITGPQVRGIRNLGRVKWLNTATGKPCTPGGRHVIAVLLDGGA